MDPVRPAKGKNKFEQSYVLKYFNYLLRIMYVITVDRDKTVHIIVRSLASRRFKMEYIYEIVQFIIYTPAEFAQSRWRWNRCYKRANSHLCAVFTIEFTYIDYIQMNFNRIPYKIARQYIFNVDERPPNFTRRIYVFTRLFLRHHSTSKHSKPYQGLDGGLSYSTVVCKKGQTCTRIS